MSECSQTRVQRCSKGTTFGLLYVYLRFLKKYSSEFLHGTNIVCPRSLDTFYITYIKWVKSFWTYSIRFITCCACVKAIALDLNKCLKQIKLTISPQCTHVYTILYKYHANTKLLWHKIFSANLLNTKLYLT